MHRLALVALALVFAGTTSGTSRASEKPVAAKPLAPHHWTVAPADEYFRPLQMSPLGIVNALTMLAAREAVGVVPVTGSVASLALVDRAIADWERKYPRDPWLARVLLAANRDYRPFDTAAARAGVRSTAYRIYTRHAYSHEAAVLFRELSQPRHAVGPAPLPVASSAPVVPDVPLPPITDAAIK